MKRNDIICEIMNVYDCCNRLEIDNKNLEQQLRDLREKRAEKPTIADKFKKYAIEKLTKDILHDGDYWYECTLRANRDEETDNIEMNYTSEEWIKNLYKHFKIPSMFCLDDLKPYLNESLSDKYTELSRKEIENFLQKEKEKENSVNKAD